MPSWMAPFKAEDVVCGERGEGDTVREILVRSLTPTVNEQTPSQDKGPSLINVTFLVN